MNFKSLIVIFSALIWACQCSQAPANDLSSEKIKLAVSISPDKLAGNNIKSLNL